MAQETARPRVVLVEDDAMLRRFVAMCLEDLPIELSLHASVAAAWPELARGGWRLLITDLMLPGESGLVLLERLASHAADADEPPETAATGASRDRGPGLTAVFSAGLTPELGERLDRLGVWRQLSKPVSVVALASCVREAISRPAPSPSASPPASRTDAAGPAPGDDPLSEPMVIEAHFAGDAELYRRFRDGCRQQFPQDRADGDAALRRADPASLQRIAHNLKSALGLLGHGRVSALARQLEDAAAVDAPETPALWSSLRQQLVDLPDNPAGP